MCTRDHLQKQCSFPQIRATLKPKSKTLKMLCVLNTVYTYVYIHMCNHVYIYIYSYSILFIFFSKTKKCTSLTAFPHLNASWSDLPLSLFQANFWICEDRVRLPTFRVAGLEKLERSFCVHRSLSWIVFCFPNDGMQSFDSLHLPIMLVGTHNLDVHIHIYIYINI